MSTEFLDNLFDQLSSGELSPAEMSLFSTGIREIVDSFTAPSRIFPPSLGYIDGWWIAGSMSGTVLESRLIGIGTSAKESVESYDLAFGDAEAALKNRDKVDVLLAIIKFIPEEHREFVSAVKHPEKGAKGHSVTYSRPTQNFIHNAGRDWSSHGILDSVMEDLRYWITDQKGDPYL